MKLINFLFFAFLFTCCSESLYGATVTWIGGNSDWETPSNWDTGQVPNTDDEVVINSGTVIIESYGSADHILLKGGQLIVESTLLIFLDDMNSEGRIIGIEISAGATFINNGVVAGIQGAIPGGPATFILNLGILTNSTEGYIYLSGTSCVGINNYSLGNFTNDGVIDIDAGSSIGIMVIDPVYNNGTININSTSRAMQVQDLFTNNISGVLNTNSSISIATTGQLINNGEISIENNSTTTFFSGVTVGGILKINNTGSLYIFGNFNFGLYCHTETRVYGDLEIDIPEPYNYAISNDGLFVNHQSGEIITMAHYGVHNNPGGDMRNYGVWNMNDPVSGGYSAVGNYGIFNNRPKGKLYVDGRIRLEPGSNFNNQGHMFVTRDVLQSLMNGSFNNTGALNDVYGKLSSITNQSYVCRPIIGTISANVPIPNALDKGISPGATVLGWFTSEFGNVSAGTYNSSTNTFTPNSNAVGLDSLFVNLKINSGNVRKRHKVLFENPIQPLSNNITDIYLEDQSIQEEYDFNVFPNPTSDLINVKSNNNNNNNNLIVTLYSLTGQAIASKNFDGEASCTLAVPEDLIDGVYYVVIYSDKEIISKKQINIIK